MPADIVELQSRRRNAVNHLIASLDGDIQVPRPDELQPFHLASTDERRRRVRFVLANAFLIWRRGGSSLVESVRESSGGEAVGEYALQEMRRVLCELNLPAWEAHPVRLRADVRSLFRRTIGRLSSRCGGWRVAPRAP